jgi:hypothetical protein
VTTLVRGSAGVEAIHASASACTIVRRPVAVASVAAIEPRAEHAPPANRRNEIRAPAP